MTSGVATASCVGCGPERLLPFPFGSSVATVARMLLVPVVLVIIVNNVAPVPLLLYTFSLYLMYSSDSIKDKYWYSEGTLNLVSCNLA